MSKIISFKKGLGSVLVWSIISAAFIGPGTVTTCSKAGTLYGFQLLWCLTFSTIATIFLQEAVARVNMATGKNLGQVIALKFNNKYANRIPHILFLIVSFGCAAYETGNILGAIAGLQLIVKIPAFICTICLGLLCFYLLWKGSIKRIAQIMGILVLAMGILFCYVALKMDFSISSLFKALFVPHFPLSASTLIIGLVGTTIVPYNLFLASSIGKDQSLGEMRIGIAIAVGIGGIISMAIMVSGLGVNTGFSYDAVSLSLEEKMGKVGSICFALGLFAAGLSSAITAPLAAAVCGKSLLGNQDMHAWATTGKYYRMTWMLVLTIGLLFGLANVQPIPAIIMAQALNGLLLPIVAIALYLTIHDYSLIPPAFQHSAKLNWVYLSIIWVACFLGIYNVQKAITRFIHLENYADNKMMWIAGLLSLGLIVLLSQDHKLETGS